MKFTKQHIPFTQVANDILNNPDISAKAKGLYAYLYSKPNGWKFSANRIKNDFSDGKRSIMTGLQELEDIGLLERTKNADGTMDYHLLYKGLSKVEIADEPENPNRIAAPKTQSAKTALRLQTQSAEIAKCGNSKVLKPQSAKTAPYIKKEFTQIKNTNKKKEGEKEDPSHFSLKDSFDLFFSKYEKPLNEEESFSEWKHLSDNERNEAIGFLDAYKQFEPNPKFRKHPNNYLSQRTWLKEKQVVLEALKHEQGKAVYYTYQQMINEVTAHPTLSTDHFQQEKHPTTGETVWLLKDKEVMNG